MASRASWGRPVTSRRCGPGLPGAARCPAGAAPPVRVAARRPGAGARGPPARAGLRARAPLARGHGPPLPGPLRRRGGAGVIAPAVAAIAVALLAYTYFGYPLLIGL